jgi:purine-binding chemotaxis protein CheW
MNTSANAQTAAPPEPTAASISADHQDYLTFTVEKQVFALPVVAVRDVLGHQAPTRIPGASPVVAGVLNLRGRIVTAIDVRHRLELQPLASDATRMSVVVDHLGELYSLTVDKVGEVLSMEADKFEDNPGTLDARWREFCKGIYRLDGVLLVVLDVTRLLDIRHDGNGQMRSGAGHRGNSGSRKTPGAE